MITHNMSYWLVRIKKHFPHVYNSIPQSTIAALYGVRLVRENHSLGKDLEYLYCPGLNYLSLKYRDKHGDLKQYGFDLERLTKDVN